jgi:hypothetical protein
LREEDEEEALDRALHTRLVEHEVIKRLERRISRGICGLNALESFIS